MLDFVRLCRMAEEVGAPLDEAQMRRLDTYAQLLVEWNEKMNLTAITAPDEMLVKHFVDSLTAAPYLPQGAFSLIDVGTGAGFPGVPLGILRPDCALTLLDSLNKRLVFLEALCGAVGVNATRVHARAEEGGQKKELRERFDVATARAVAALPVLCEYCLPFVKVGGVFLALKGPDADNEVAAAENALKKLGGRVREVVALTLPDGAGGVLERRLVVVEKVSPTPANFPRPSAKMAKQPL